ncbi:unnamed protein product [Phytophthora fragariaefolia]|uniref:Unnamed protein product n=1 Tax=Phytophthora fragariaefolia TaxID=1490495 RepID=A0A9W6XV07_9STRA|nr:unnamed protein product [Phytophthora fragariaefolia]
MSNKVELNKDGRPVGCHGQSWMYCKNMMLVAFEEKGIREYAIGDKTLARRASNNEKKEFNEAHAKVKMTIMASLSREFGQRLMMKTTGSNMWKYLEQLYDGIQNDATRTNQEIILYNKLQSTKCKPNWDVAQRVYDMFMLRAQLAALKADMRDPIFIHILMRSLPSNQRFDRLRGMVEAGAKESQNPGQGQNPKQSHNSAQIGGTKKVAPERAALLAAKKTDQHSGSCFLCHKSCHLQKDCPKPHNPNLANSSQSKRLVAAYSRRVRLVTSADENAGHPQTHASTRRPEESSARVTENTSTTGATDQGTDEYTTWEWCFDNAANVHIACDMRYFSGYKEFVPAEADCVRGFQQKFATTPLGHGSVKVVVRKESQIRCAQHICARRKRKNCHHPGTKHCGSPDVKHLGSR